MNLVSHMCYFDLSTHLKDSLETLFKRGKFRILEQNHGIFELVYGNGICACEIDVPQPKEIYKGPYVLSIFPIQNKNRDENLALMSNVMRMLLASGGSQSWPCEPFHSYDLYELGSCSVTELSLKISDLGFSINTDCSTKAPGNAELCPDFVSTVQRSKTTISLLAGDCLKIDEDGFNQYIALCPGRALIGKSSRLKLIADLDEILISSGCKRIQQAIGT